MMIKCIDRYKIYINPRKLLIYSNEQKLNEIKIIRKK